MTGSRILWNDWGLGFDCDGERDGRLLCVARTRSKGKSLLATASRTLLSESRQCPLSLHLRTPPLVPPFFPRPTKWAASSASLEDHWRV